MREREREREPLLSHGNLSKLLLSDLFILKILFWELEQRVGLLQVRYESKLMDESGEVPISNGVAGSSIPTMKSSLYLMEKN